MEGIGSQPDLHLKGNISKIDSTVYFILDLDASCLPKEKFHQNILVGLKKA